MKVRAGVTIIVGGLHRNDFEWASKEHEADGYVLVAFEVDRDGYHWRATYIKSDVLETGDRGRTTRLCLSQSLRQGEHPQ